MQRPQRVRKKTFKASDSQLDAASVSIIADSRVAKKRKLHALQPVPVEQVAAPEILVNPLPYYQPPLQLHSFSSRPRIRPQSPIEAFQLFLTRDVVDIIVANTNSYAENHREAATAANTSYSRPWHPTRASEIWRYIGCLFYMGLHIEKERAEYWQDSHRLGSYIGRERFEQIHRYFTIRDGSLYPAISSEDFTWHLEPVATMIRLSYQQNWSPGSHLTIDESMIPFRGRSEHTVKMKNKPISEGYKVWVLANQGFIWSFLWYSCTTGTEGIYKKQGLLVDLPIPFRPVRLASTFATVIRLAQQLRFHVDPVFPRVRCLFLDNLFLNQDVCLALLALNIVCMGTTRKNAIGMSPRLIAMKQQNRGLVWNSASAEIVEGVLQFLWQDNNTVLGITTAYSLHQTVLRERKRPALTSTNAHIVRPVFGDQVKKWLQIPLAIDAYNHGMNGVDRANQLQRSYTTHRPQVYRTWQPQWHWLLDTCATNAFLILNHEHEDLDHRGHHNFQEDLALGLLAFPDDGPPQVVKTIQTSPQPWPRWIALAWPKRCVWCREHRANAARRAKSRKVLAEIVNEAQGYLPQTRAACCCHGVALCRKGDCWDLYHTQMAESSK